MNLLFDCAGKPLDLSTPKVMGVLNVTPDSFSDGGRFLAPDRACEQARRMVEAGAAIVDVGGESTRPGARTLSEAEEIDRVVPVIERLARELPVPLSIDSRKPGVMRAAVDAGAGLINDVNALREPGALEAARELGVPVCLMHMQGSPETMQQAPHYAGDVVAAVKAFLSARIDACGKAGLPRARLLIDPGFGFGKRVEHNLRLLACLPEFAALECPLLVGLSRKSMIGSLLGLDVGERLVPSVALALMAVERGARLVRAHDVAETCQALRLLDAVRSAACRRTEADH